MEMASPFQYAETHRRQNFVILLISSVSTFVLFQQDMLIQVVIICLDLNDNLLKKTKANPVRGSDRP